MGGGLSMDAETRAALEERSLASAQRDLAMKRNYFAERGGDPAGLKQRWEANDQITEVVDLLRGGRMKDPQTGRWTYNESQRLMNEDGVNKVALFMTSAVNRIAHLTSFKTEDRIMVQMRNLMPAFLKELTLNMKRWAPAGEEKVRNKLYIVELVANRCLQSMQRGVDALEAKLSAPNVSMSYATVGSEGDRGQRSNLMRGSWFGRGKE